MLTFLFFLYLCPRKGTKSRYFEMGNLSAGALESFWKIIAFAVYKTFQSLVAEGYLRKTRRRSRCTWTLLVS